MNAHRKGIGGHQSADAHTTTWLTPRFVLNALGRFDLDPCAAPDPAAWPTAAEHYVWPAQDGLALPWHGRVWLNPPYGNAVGRWLGRLADHGTGTALVFARTETDAFFKGVWERAHALLFLRGRLYFHRADLVRADANAGAPNVLAAYGKYDAEMLLDCGIDGAVVPLNRPTMLFMALVRDPPMPAWRETVAAAMATLGGRATLSDLYSVLEDHPKTQNRPHWQAKVRQTIARMGLPQVAPATYATPDLFAAA